MPNNASSIEKIDKNNNIKDDLNHLYKISNYREFTICAANSRTIEKIEKELSDKGFVLNEWRRNNWN